jgi:hypothetical protein
MEYPLLKNEVKNEIVLGVRHSGSNKFVRDIDLEVDLILETGKKIVVIEAKNSGRWGFVKRSPFSF